MNQRTRAEKAERQARRADRASTLRSMGDASSWLALPMTKARRTSIGRRAEPRRSERERDPGYMDKVRALPCCARHLGSCFGAVEADHAGARPAGRKASDGTCIPLCRSHHRQRTDFTGDFRDFDQARMRAFLVAAIAHTQTVVAQSGGIEAA